MTVVLEYISSQPRGVHSLVPQTLAQVHLSILDYKCALETIAPQTLALVSRSASRA